MRRLIALGLDLVVIFVVVPAVTLFAVMLPLGWVFGELSSGPDLDGSAMAAASVWMLLALAIAIAYWPVLYWRKKRSVGRLIVDRISRSS